MLSLHLMLSFEKTVGSSSLNPTVQDHEVHALAFKNNSSSCLSLTAIGTAI